MKKITARMIREKCSCYNPTDLEGVDSTTEWTLLEWMNYKHYKTPVEDAVWVFCHLADERMAREFAIWCARRCNKGNKANLHLIDVAEGYYLKGTHTREELDEAWDSAWDSAAAASALDSAWDSAWCSAWDSAWDSAGDSAWYSAWDSAWARAKERKAQLAKIKRMLRKAERSEG